MGWLPFVKSWLQKLPTGDRDELKPHLLGLFERHIDAGLDFIRKFCTEVIPQV